MKSKSNEVVRLEGWIAFLIPFLTVVGGSSLLADSIWGRYIALVCLALVGGLSGAKSFLSTTFADSNSARVDAVPTTQQIIANADAQLNQPTPSPKP
jgi:hypothetical protein